MIAIKIDGRDLLSNISMIHVAMSSPQDVKMFRKTFSEWWRLFLLWHLTHGFEIFKKWWKMAIGKIKMTLQFKRRYFFARQAFEYVQ